jgi:dUTP pyrophosphatase
MSKSKTTAVVGTTPQAPPHRLPPSAAPAPVVDTASESGAIFKDISETDRNGGSVPVEKIAMNVALDTEAYLGGNVIVAKPPLDANDPPPTPGGVTTLAPADFPTKTEVMHDDLIPGELLEIWQPKLKVKRLHPDAQLPRYATPGAACFDLHALFDEHDPEFKSVVTNRPKEFRTGLAFEVPEGFVMLVFSRSGHGFNNDVRLSNCVGVIDSDYRGEVRVKLTADTVAAHLPVRPGDRIAQAMLIQVPQWEIEEVDELSETERGDGGFGSTGS